MHTKKQFRLPSAESAVGMITARLLTRPRTLLKYCNSTKNPTHHYSDQPITTGITENHDYNHQCTIIFPTIREQLIDLGMIFSQKIH